MSGPSSYPSPFSVTHKAARALWADPDRLLEVTEKIDGSQFSCHVPNDGPPTFRSRGAVIDAAAPPQMFGRAVATFMARFAAGRLARKATYRGEVLDRPKHNVLAYLRVPKDYVILFDVMMGEEDYYEYEMLHLEGLALGLEVVPLLWQGRAAELTASLLDTFLERTSILGEVPIEGVVIKPANRDVFGIDKKLLVAKHVSPAFKETHRSTWKGEHGPAGGQKQEILSKLGADYCTTARWQKAVQHLREAGTLLDAPQDIPALLHEVVADIEKECTAEIKDALYSWARKDLTRSWVRGLPEWYKQQLMAGLE